MTVNNEHHVTECRQDDLLLVAGGLIVLGNRRARVDLDNIEAE